MARRLTTGLFLSACASSNSGFDRGPQQALVQASWHPRLFGPHPYSRPGRAGPNVPRRPSGGRSERAPAPRLGADRPQGTPQGPRTGSSGRRSRSTEGAAIRRSSRLPRAPYTSSARPAAPVAHTTAREARTGAYRPRKCAHGRVRCAYVEPSADTCTQSRSMWRYVCGMRTCICTQKALLVCTVSHTREFAYRMATYVAFAAPVSACESRSKQDDPRGIRAGPALRAPARPLSGDRPFCRVFAVRGVWYTTCNARMRAGRKVPGPRGHREGPGDTAGGHK